MDMTEISTISHRKQKITRHFCLRTSPCGRFYCLMLAGTAVVNRIHHTPTADHAGVNFHVSQLLCPDSIATQTLPRDLEAIYESATYMEKTSLALNPLMCYKYVENVSVHLVDLQVSPNLRGRVNDILIASQNSMGCIHFFTAPIVWRKWVLVLDVAKELIERRHDGGIHRNYKDFEVAIENHVISAFCWTMSSEETKYKFCTVVKSGIAIFCTYDRVVGFDIVFESNLHVPNIMKIHWFQMQQRNYVVAAAATGQIYLFVVNEEDRECTRVSELWSDSDYLTVDHMEVNTEGVEALLLAIKDCFLLAFILNGDGNILCTHVELGAAAIVGLTHISAWEYLVICADRVAKLIRISANETDIDIQELEVKTNLPERYTIAGGVVSPHRVFWMFAGELLEPHDPHNPAVSSVIVTICSSIDGNCPLDMLSRTSQNFASMADCQEALRIRWFKECDVDSYYVDLVTQPLYDDEASLINLRKRLIYLGAKCGALKYGYQAQSTLFRDEFRYILRVLVVMWMHRNLLKLKQHQEMKKLTKLQANAVKHLKVGIREFLMTPVPEEYAAGIEPLRYIFETTIQNTLEPKCVLILCQLCQGEVNEDTLICGDGHELRRCILTNFQIFIMNEAICPQCEQLIIKDRPLLTEILLLNANDEIKCPVCDVVINVD